MALMEGEVCWIENSAYKNVIFWFKKDSYYKSPEFTLQYSYQIVIAVTVYVTESWSDGVWRVMLTWFRGN